MSHHGTEPTPRKFSARGPTLHHKSHEEIILVNWNEISRLLSEIRFTHSACIETPPFAFGPDYNIQAWKKLRTETARLLPCEGRASRRAILHHLVLS